MLSTSSSKTTILDVLGSELAVNAFETIVVEPAFCAVPVINTNPSSPGTSGP